MTQEVSNQNAKKIKNSMTEVEIAQIQAQRKFSEINPGSPRYRLGVHLDAFRKNSRVHKTNVRKIINHINSTRLSIERLKDELKTGDITSEIADGVKMNEDELKLDISLKENLIERELEQLKLELWQLAQLVGLVDVIGNTIITEEEYEIYFISVEEDLKQLMGEEFLLLD